MEDKRLTLTGGIGISKIGIMSKMYAGVDKKVDSNIANLAESQIQIRDILKLFTVEESIKISYMPIILMDIAMEYMNNVADICISKRLECTKSEIRYYKKIRDEYKVFPFEFVEIDVLKYVKDSSAKFFEMNPNDTTAFYFTVSNALLRSGIRDYIGMDNDKHDILDYTVCAISLMDYIEKIDDSATRIITKRVHEIGGTYTGIIGQGSRFMPYLKAFKIIGYNILLNVYKKENLKESDIKDDLVKRIVRIIALKIDDIIKPLIEEEKENNKKTKIYKDE